MLMYTNSLSILTKHTFAHAHTHLHTPLRAGDNCLAVYAPTIVRLPGQREPGKEEGEGKGASYEWHHRVGTRRIRQVPW